MRVSVKLIFGGVGPEAVGGMNSEAVSVGRDLSPCYTEYVKLVRKGILDTGTPRIFFKF